MPNTFTAIRTTLRQEPPQRYGDTAQPNYAGYMLTPSKHVFGIA
ncbi:MAG: hypothetical protein QXT44_02895 [Candidatus Bathyarchaeia archaeon]